MTTWHLINVILPISLPPLILLALYLLHLGSAQRARVAPWTSVKDGQLAWVALGMCLNAMYELQHSMSIATAGELHEWLLYELVGLIALSTLIAALGPALSNPGARTPGFLGWISDYRSFLGSLFMSGGAAYLYTIVHNLTQH